MYKRYVIALFIAILIVIAGIQQVDSQIQIKNNNIKQEEKQKVQQVIKPIVDNYIIMEATGYDLSIRCCGKSYNHPSRGIARDGYNLNNKSHSEAWTVSSNKFSLGTKLQLEFPEGYEKYNGIYICRDTGSFKKGVLDIYIGDFGEKVGKETIEFGRVEVKVKVLDDRLKT